MGDLFEVKLRLIRFIELPSALWKRIKNQRRYRCGTITYGCAGLMVVTQVNVDATSRIGPWEIDMSGISLIAGKPRQERSECSPDLVSPYLAHVLVGYKLGLDFDGSREHLLRIQEQNPEIRNLQV